MLLRKLWRKTPYEKKQTISIFAGFAAGIIWGILGTPAGQALIKHIVLNWPF